MALIVSQKSGNSIPPLDPGVYMAVCVWIVDLGEQHSEKFSRYQKKILFGFEICGEDIERGNGPEPRMLSMECTASLNMKSRLYQILVSWRGRDFTEEEMGSFDLASMLGESAQVQVLVNENERNTIQALIGLPRGVKPQTPRMELQLFDMDDASTHAALDKLPEWIRERAQKSTDWAKLHANEERIDMETGEVTRPEQPAGKTVPGKAGKVGKTAASAPF